MLYQLATVEMNAKVSQVLISLSKAPRRSIPARNSRFHFWILVVLPPLFSFPLFFSYSLFATDLEQKSDGIP